MTTSKWNPFSKVPAAPTNPHGPARAKQFDVADLYQGPASGTGASTETAVPVDEKLRQAYFWIANNAIISPYYDIEYNDKVPQSFVAGSDLGGHPDHVARRRGGAA